MKSPNVCTGPTSHGRIVSSNPQPLGATTCQAKNQLIDSQLTEGSKTQIRNPQSGIRNSLEVPDLALFNPFYFFTRHSQPTATSSFLVTSHHPLATHFGFLRNFYRPVRLGLFYFR